MAEFRIPVVYSMYGHVNVEASSYKKALKYAREHLDELPLPDDSYYLEDSYEIDEEVVELDKKLEENK